MMIHPKHASKNCFLTLLWRKLKQYQNLVTKTLLATKDAGLKHKNQIWIGLNAFKRNSCVARSELTTLVLMKKSKSVLMTVVNMNVSITHNKNWTKMFQSRPNFKTLTFSTLIVMKATEMMTIVTILRSKIVKKKVIVIPNPLFISLFLKNRLLQF